jgi:imidazolonepropionase-like amidohydrolase
MNARNVAALALGGCLLLVQPAAAAKEDVYAIVGARIVPVSGPPVDSGTLVLRDGLIEAVGAGIRPPADARVIDGKGLTLTPGLIDGFGGLGLPPAAPRGAARGGSGAAGTAAPEPSALAPQDLAKDRVRVADALRARDTGVTTALVIGRDGVLPGRSVLLNLAGDTVEAMTLMQPAALHLHMTSLARQYPGSLMGTVAYVRQALLDAGRYREAWAAYERSPRGKKRPVFSDALAAWQDVLSGKLPLIVTASRENDIRRTLALADEFKVKVVVAGAPQAHRLAGLIKSRGLPLLVGVNFDPPRATSSFGGADDEQERRDIEEAERNPAELHAAGVPFALVSAHAASFTAGIQKAVDRGLPREVALRAVTLVAAEILGMADRTGSLERGKLANVVAWSGEPLTRAAKVKLVFVDGRLHEPEEKAENKGQSPSDGRPKADDGGPGDRTAAEDKPDKPPAPGPLPWALPAPVPSADATGRLVAIVGGTVLTVGPQGPIEKGTVLVRDGRIAAVGKDVVVPRGATVIEATGRFVTPGIIDPHSHTAIEGSVNECTDVITAEVRVGDVIDHRDVNIYRQLAGGVTTIDTLHGSCNAIGGQNAVLKMRWGKSPEEMRLDGAPRSIKLALGENPKRSNARTPGQPRYPGTRMGVEAVIREAFQQARAYGREWEEYERKVQAVGPRGDRPVPPRRDLRLETLKEVLDCKVLVHAHCYRSDEILMLIHLAEEFGFKINTLEHVLEGYKVASEIARHGAGASTFIDWWAFKMEALDAIPYNPAVMASKGVRVALHSDSDELARRLYWDAAKAVKYGGVSEAQALEMITINPAWQMGLDERLGSIEVGKEADLVVFSAHPFAPDARVLKTLVDGVVYFDRDRDLSARAAASPPAATPSAPEGGAQ